MVNHRRPTVGSWRWGLLAGNGNLICSWVLLLLDTHSVKYRFSFMLCVCRCDIHWSWCLPFSSMLANLLTSISEMPRLASENFAAKEVWAQVNLRRHNWTILKSKWHICGKLCIFQLLLIHSLRQWLLAWIKHRHPWLLFIKYCLHFFYFAC